MSDAAWAVLFPGQGVQYVGMGQALAQASPLARQVFEEADAVLGYSLSRLMWEGPEDRLRLTEIQQPAILTVSVAVWRAVPWPSRPRAAVGLSLGEYSALVASGLLSFADALRVVEVRGRAMQAAVPDGTGGMTAVMGLDAATVQALCDAVAAAGVVEPANYNSPGQIVVAGTVAGLAALEERVKAAGGRAVRLPVSAPFHSRLLKPAEAPLARALAGVAWHTAAFPVVANVDGFWVTAGEHAVPRLIQQVSRPVLFEQAIRQLLAAGVDRFIEVGPGRSLATLVRRIDRRAAAASVEDPASFAGALELA